MDRPPSFLRAEGITKTFPEGVVANDSIDLAVQRGEVHGVLGENGAGKSTLMKILYGLYEPDSGEIYLDGDLLELESPRDAIDAGIGMVHQHFMLIPRLTVFQNVILGRRESPLSSHDERGDSAEPFWRRWARLLSIDTDSPIQEINELSEQYGMDIDTEAEIWELDVGEQQRVEIIKALYWDAELLILDEPTAVLTPNEVDHLFGVLGQLVSEGLTIIFISHKLDEVLDVTDRVTVLRRGRVVDTVETLEVSQSELARMMVGREIDFTIEKTGGDSGETVLHATGIQARDDRGLNALSGVDLHVRRGEVVGIAGVSGNGQTELAECLTGLRPIEEGTILINGVDLSGRSPRQFLDAGVSYIPEDRIKYGCAPSLSTTDNMIMKKYRELTNYFVLDYERGFEYARELIDAYDIRGADVDDPVNQLSGGNLQKLIVSRELSRQPDLLIAHQPTRGVDVGSIEYIHDILLSQRDQGTGVLLISEKLDEVLQLSDRVLIMYEGELVAEIEPDDVDIDHISKLMNSGRRRDADPTVARE